MTLVAKDTSNQSLQLTAVSHRPQAMFNSRAPIFYNAEDIDVPYGYGQCNRDTIHDAAKQHQTAAFLIENLSRRVLQNFRQTGSFLSVRISDFIMQP
jgi:hypothetical protein